MRRLRLAVVLIAAVALAACSRDGAGSLSVTAPPPVSPTVVGATTSPAPPPLTPATPPPTDGPATPTCVGGWITPPRSSQPYLQPLGIIRRTTGVDGPLVGAGRRSFAGAGPLPCAPGNIR